MAEQITLFEENKTLEEQLSDIVEQVKEKYSYNKMHISGMYEMIKSAPQSELYYILELRTAKDKSVSLYFDGQLCIKFVVKNETMNITKELYTALLNGKPAEELKGNAAPKGGVCVAMNQIDEISFFAEALEYLVKIKKPLHKFACCSQYEKCSKKKRCLHENQYYAKGCYYRENLDYGNIFYK